MRAVGIGIQIWYHDERIRNGAHVRRLRRIRINARTARRSGALGLTRRTRCRWRTLLRSATRTCRRARATVTRCGRLDQLGGTHESLRRRQNNGDRFEQLHIAHISIQTRGRVHIRTRIGTRIRFQFAAAYFLRVAAIHDYRQRRRCVRVLTRRTLLTILTGQPD